MPKKRRPKSKTIDDVTQDEWAKLAIAAVEGLSCIRFLIWLNYLEEGKDRSALESADQLGRALADIGLEQYTQTEFNTNVEDLLQSGLSIDQWRAMKNS